MSFRYDVSVIYVTRPAKGDLSGQKYIISQSSIYLEFRAQYLHAVRCTINVAYEIMY